MQALPGRSPHRRPPPCRTHSRSRRRRYTRSTLPVTIGASTWSPRRGQHPFRTTYWPRCRHSGFRRKTDTVYRVEETYICEKGTVWKVSGTWSRWKLGFYNIKAGLVRTQSEAIWEIVLLGCQSVAGGGVGSREGLQRLSVLACSPLCRLWLEARISRHCIAIARSEHLQEHFTRKNMDVASKTRNGWARRHIY